MQQNGETRRDSGKKRDMESGIRELGGERDAKKERKTDHRVCACLLHVADPSGLYIKRLGDDGHAAYGNRNGNVRRDGVSGGRGESGVRRDTGDSPGDDTGERDGPDRHGPPARPTRKWNLWKGTAYGTARWT